MAYEETRIRVLFHLIGWTRIIGSWVFIVAFIASIVTVCAFSLTGHTEDAIRTLCPLLMTVSGALIAVAVAGLAIVVSMSSASYLIRLKEAGIFESVLMLYWIPAFSAGLSMVFNGTSIGFTIVKAPSGLLIVFLFLSLLFFGYALASVIMVVGTTVRFGVYRGKFVEEDMKASLEAKKDSEKTTPVSQKSQANSPNDRT
jgi:hypothetical protein